MHSVNLFDMINNISSFLDAPNCYAWGKYPVCENAELFFSSINEAFSHLLYNVIRCQCHWHYNLFWFTVHPFSTKHLCHLYYSTIGRKIRFFNDCNFDPSRKKSRWTLILLLVALATVGFDNIRITEWKHDSLNLLKKKIIT